MNVLVYNAMGSIIIAIAIHISGCGLNQIRGETLDIWDKAVFSLDVTTTPDGAKLNLHNIDRGLGAMIHSAHAPQRVYYTHLPSYGAYLQVSYPDYRTYTIRLNPDKKKIHVKLEPIIKKKKQCSALLTLSKAFIRPSNLPDLSYLTGQESIPDLINTALAADIKNPPDEECMSEEKLLVNTVVTEISVEDAEFTPEKKPYTGKINIISSLSNTELLLDGYLMGNIPIEIPVQAGFHRIALRKGGNVIWAKRITIDDRQEKSIKVEKAPGPTEIAHSGMVN